MNQDFNSIRAYEDEDLHEVLSRVAQDETFKHLLPQLGQLMGSGFDTQRVIDALQKIQNVGELDQYIVFPLLDRLLKVTTSGLTLTGFKNLKTTESALFLTNHRDIILDSAFLSYAYKQQTGDRIYIGIGTNLYAQPWIEDFVRANKAFSVIRGGNPRQILTNSSLLSGYILHIISELHHNVWLAQREGRAKDGNDRTQPAVLKMLTMAGEGTLQERVEKMNITPVSLSYEYDPCDYLKAKEMQIKRDNGVYVKTKADDLLSMKTGLMGWKGKVAFCITPSINSELTEAISQHAIRNEQIEHIAQIIDKHIHRHYHIFNTNKIAYDAYLHTDKFAKDYTEDEKMVFAAYIDKKIGLIKDITPDKEFLREKILEMYANPLINQLRQI